ncbi:GntR family transcriptional regulator [Curvibacter gracilis]|uniref:GntR family transcriptional regulator n=1 Tax=Curvibacter gracilis TaxID=230310 RepID=UPI0004818E9B|nr:GntR family transcriptional regulator [Curvibacter gracilis]
MAQGIHTDLMLDLSQGISSGRYPVGSLLPTEFELCERYGASRYAVRQALQALQDLGLISRRKNVGTRVEATQPAAGFTQSIATVDELAQFGATHVRQLHGVEEIVADLPLAALLGCPGGSRWLRISSLRMDQGSRHKPICWTDVYVDPACAGVAEWVEQSPDVLISTLIEQRFGHRIARVRQDVRAIHLPEKTAELLQAEPGMPALQLIRHYIDASDKTFEISVTVHPSDRFTFTMEMERK